MSESAARRSMDFRGKIAAAVSQRPTRPSLSLKRPSPILAHPSCSAENGEVVQRIICGAKSQEKSRMRLPHNNLLDGVPVLGFAGRSEDGGAFYWRMQEPLFLWHAAEVLGAQA